FPHFSEQYGVDEQQLLELYHIALGNCFWADIILSPHVKDADEQNARIVLLLFLEPADGEGVCSQREAIRAQADAQAYETIAEKAGVPLEFVLSLIAGEQQEALP
ncbi:MAG: hypothetical protein Q4A66_10635, partial [Eubacteriales bacterium]|nr:hypothetical protein [Eubacteriales bacterium]